MPDVNKLKEALPEGISIVMIVGALEDSGYSIDPPIITDEGEPVAPSEEGMAEEVPPEEAPAEDPIMDAPPEEEMGGAAGDMFAGMENESADPVGPPPPVGRLSRKEQAGKLDEMNLDEYEE